ncbi:hypothetical protein J31TS4_03090 [Paenibacillus sp. J31TS4]|uniref:hypothetical protein n=1 Tax=Paenibacillus sp. J31TS4 TaxID=2807195 RepID=UPI001B1CC2D0|nr:hypothetical protein [Paenibacillus sp. J31TS4]GIP37029.1 hypothetical protein J31TS4_03090 [Paenibacillus sp. J31TS4]
MEARNKWYLRPTNMARGLALAIWLAGTVVVLAIYQGEDRSALWGHLSGSCALLFFYSFLIPFIARIAKHQDLRSKVNYMFVFFYLAMLVFLLLRIGITLLDIAAGPITENVTIVDRWNPKRGGDHVKTSDGSNYEIHKEHVYMEVGHTYRAKLFRYNRLIISLEQVK